MRTWKELLAGLVAITAIAVSLPHAHAAAPAVNAPAPGFGRTMLGSFAVTAVDACVGHEGTKPDATDAGDGRGHVGASANRSVAC
jgi:hypothetical protein